MPACVCCTECEQRSGPCSPCQRWRRPGRRSNLEDPYIRLGGDGEGSEEADDAIRDSDLVILAARNEDDVSHLEVAPLTRSGWPPGAGRAYPCRQRTRLRLVCSEERCQACLIMATRRPHGAVKFIIMIIES